MLGALLEKAFATVVGGCSGCVVCHPRVSIWLSTALSRGRALRVTEPSQMDQVSAKIPRRDAGDIGFANLAVQFTEVGADSDITSANLVALVSDEESAQEVSSCQAGGAVVVGDGTLAIEAPYLQLVRDAEATRTEVIAVVFPQSGFCEAGSITGKGNALGLLSEKKFSVRHHKVSSFAKVLL